MVAHLLVRLLVLAVIAPISSLLLSIAIAARGQSAFTDQDIAYFLFTPAGMCAGLAVACLLIVGAILDVSIMTCVLRARRRNIAGVIGHGVRPILSRLPALALFSLRLVAKVLLIAAPFLLAVGAVALIMLRQYDINYYLTHWPPEFVFAVAVISALILALIFLLLARLSGWAISLHLLLFSRFAPAAAFKDSAQRLSGQRKRLIVTLVIWALSRAALGLIVTAIAGMLLNVVPLLFGASLGAAATAAITILVLLTFANAFVAAVSNGALTDLLNRLYTGATQDLPRPAEMSTEPDDKADRTRIPAVALIGAATAAVAIGLFAGGMLLENITTKRSVEIIAHRGASASRPENTLAAVDKAVEDQADWVEIDVQETADGEVVVAHDSDLMKLGGDALKVWDATMEKLAQIDIGSWFDPAYSGERTPTLRQALELVKGRSKLLIELKYYGHDVELESRVVRIVEETGMARDIAVMSLKYDGIRKMQSLRPSWRYGVLAAKAIGDLAALKADFLAVNTGQASLALIRRAHARGKQIYVWTVDEPLTMSRMISMGVDGLITNKPALARRVMDARNDLTTYERLALWITDRFRIGTFELVAEESDA